MSEPVTLKPCPSPSCDAPDCPHVEASGPVARRCWWVRCLCCDAQGPVSFTSGAHAGELWDALPRTPAPPAPAANRICSAESGKDDSHITYFCRLAPHAGDHRHCWTDPTFTSSPMTPRHWTDDDTTPRTLAAPPAPQGWTALSVEAQLPVDGEPPGIVIDCGDRRLHVEFFPCHIGASRIADDKVTHRQSTECDSEGNHSLILDDDFAWLLAIPSPGTSAPSREDVLREAATACDEVGDERRRMLDSIAPGSNHARDVLGAIVGAGRCRAAILALINKEPAR